MQYKKIDEQPNNVSWGNLNRFIFSKMPKEFYQLIDKSWNGPYGIRTLGATLGYIEDMPEYIFVTKPNYDKRYFRCRNVHGKLIEVRLDFDANNIPTIETSRDNVSKTYQCLCCYGTKKTYINLASCSYKEGEMEISRFLFPNQFAVYLDKGAEHLDISMEDLYNNTNKHFMLYDEDTIFKNICKLDSLYDIPSICAFLYHNNGQMILDNIIEIGNYDELDDEDNSILVEGFRVRIQNGELIHYQERKLIRPSCFVTIIADLVDGEYQYDYKALGFTEEGELAVKEEIEAYMADMKTQISNINEELIKKLR